VAGYMAGLVGSSNNPISGVTIATILSSSLILLVLLGSDAANGPAAAILIGAVVCCAAAIAGDNMQDLKAGYVLGATPRTQQIMQMVGVLAAAFVIAPVQTLLLEGSGFGAATAEHPNPLPAPQATLMKSVADGIFGGDLPWPMVSIGAIIGLIVIVIDQILEKRNAEFRMPVLAVAVGIYLPLELDSAIFVGGLLAWIIEKRRERLFAGDETGQNFSRKTAMLFASGLITGEAMMGVLISIPPAVDEPGLLQVMEAPPLGSLPGLIALALIAWWMLRKSTSTAAQ